MAADWLLESTLAGTAAILLVLALRRPLRRLSGAGPAYALWMLVPAALVAVGLPAATEPLLPGVVRVLPGLVAPMAPASPGGAFAPSLLLPAAWAAGALAMAAWLGSQQRRFLAGLGPLRRRPDGYYQSIAVHGLPAVVGLRPRIVLPGDFERRYGAAERELVLAHEVEHLRRGDLPASGLALLLRVLFWFNPLVHYAAARFRHDQELACDAAVLRRFPTRRRDYGDAMLKTQLADQPLPLGCHWFGSHPMKERFAMLKLAPPSPRRRIAGLALVAFTGLATATLAWATQPAAADGERTTPPPGMAGEGIQGQVPAYPEAAAQAGEGGMVMLKVLVGTDGSAREVQFVADKSTVAADSEIARNTLQVAGDWKFQPARENGKPVEGWVMVPVKFEPPAKKATDA